MHLKNLLQTLYGVYNPLKLGKQSDTNCMEAFITDVFVVAYGTKLRDVLLHGCNTYRGPSRGLLGCDAVRNQKTSTCTLIAVTTPNLAITQVT